MTQPGRLSAPGTRVVLVDVARYGHDSDLEDLPSARGTVEALRTTLIQRCGLTEENVPPPVHDPQSPAEIGAALRTQAELATDVLVFYFCGHGLIGADGQLYLASTRARRDGLANLAYAALSYPQVLATLAECRAKTTVIMLDCCYAGRAAAPAVGMSAALAAPGVPAGGYVLAAVGPNVEAQAPPGQAYTAFGGALISLLRDGVVDGPRALRLTDVFRHLERILADQGRPYSYAIGSASELIITDNPRYRAPMIGPVELAIGDETGAPYRGLAAYQQGDQELFFGRAALSEELAAAVADQLGKPGPLVVLGPSGAGKSSLLRAGLRPRLDVGLPGAPEIGGWPKTVVSVRAGDPMRALVEPLAALRGKEIVETEAALAEPDGLGVVAREVVARHADPGTSSNRLVLILDQVEELYSAQTPRLARERFLAALNAATMPGPDGSPPPVLAVLALRADFYGRALTDPLLATSLTDKHTFDVTPMDRTELIEVITRPAEAAGLAVEPELLTRILADLETADEPGTHDSTLPLLSHTLLETWRRRDSAAAALTLRGYEAAGGVRGAVAYTAARAWSGDDDGGDDGEQRLDAAERDLARSCLLQLVRVGDPGTEPTRRRAALSELLDEVTVGRMDDQERVEAVARVIGKLATNRLITVGRDATTGVDYAEITHDALLRTWGQLREWIEEDRAGLVTGRQAAEAAREWAAHGERPDDLYHGSRLDVALDWVRSGGYVPPAVAEFLDRGDAARVARERAERRRGRRARALIYTFAVLGLALATLAGLTFVALNNSRRDLAQLQSEQIAAVATSLFGTNPALARDLALSAYQESRTDAAAQALVTASVTPTDTTITVPGAALTAAFSPGGAVLAVSDNGQGDTVGLWQDMVAPRKVATLPVQHTCALTFLPTGQTLATVCRGVVSFWDVIDPRRPRLATRFGAQSQRTQTVAVSPNGQWLADGTVDGVVQLWNIADPAHTRLAGTATPDRNGSLHSLSFNSSSTLLAIADERQALVATLPDLNNLLPIQQTEPGEDAIIAVAFEPNTTVLAVGDSSGTSYWDVSDPANPQQAVAEHDTPTFAGPVSTLAVSPDGGFLAGGKTEGGIQLAGVGRNGGSEPYTFPSSAEVASVSFSPDYVAGAGSDGVVHIWPIGSHPVEIGLAALGEQPGPMISDDDRVLVDQVVDSDSGNRRLDVWDVTQPQHPAQVGTLPANWQFGEFVGGGRIFAAQSADGTQVQLWDLSKPSAPVPIGGPIFDDPASVSWASNQTGDLLAGTDHDSKTITVWNISNPRAPFVQARIDAAQADDDETVAVQFIGNSVVTIQNGDDTGMLRWDVNRRGTPVGLGTVRLSEQANTNTTVFGSPGCPTFATQAGSNPIQLWSGANQHTAAGDGSIAVPNNTSDGGVSIAMTSSCLLVEAAANNTDNSIQVWNVADAHAPRRLTTIPVEGLVQNLTINGDAGLIAANLAPLNGDSLFTSGTTDIWSRAEDGSYHQVGALSSDSNRNSTTFFLPHTDDLAFNPSPGGSVGNSALPDIVDPEPDKIDSQLCATTQRVLTESLWNKYVDNGDNGDNGDIAYVAPCQPR